MSSKGQGHDKICKEGFAENKKERNKKRRNKFGEENIKRYYLGVY